MLSRFLLSSRTFSKIFFAVCADPSRIGNGFCDDATNNEVCEWDGGDCCGDNVNNLFCNVCRCNYSFIPDLYVFSAILLNKSSDTVDIIFITVREKVEVWKY